jgi:hypothetical protein
MQHLAALEPVDYLVLGHLTCDLTPDGPRLGGGAAYAALTARAMGLRAGIVTAWGREIPLSELEGIPVVALEAGHSTTFENIYTPKGRVQILRLANIDIRGIELRAERGAAEMIAVAHQERCDRSPVRARRGAAGAAVLMNGYAAKDRVIVLHTAVDQSNARAAGR